MSDAEEKNNERPGKKENRPTASFSGSAPGGQIGPFRIERELGRGAVGVVYLAHDTKLDRPIAGLLAEADELTAIVAGSRKTAKSNR